MNQVLKYLIIGLGLRLAIAPFFMHLWDVTTLFTATDQFLAGLNPYSYVAARSADLQETTGLPSTLSPRLTIGFWFKQVRSLRP